MQQNEPKRPQSSFLVLGDMNDYQFGHGDYGLLRLLDGSVHVACRFPSLYEGGRPIIVLLGLVVGAVGPVKPDKSKLFTPSGADAYTRKKAIEHARIWLKRHPAALIDDGLWKDRGDYRFESNDCLHNSDVPKTRLRSMKSSNRINYTAARNAMGRGRR